MNRTKVLCYVALVAGAGAAGVQLFPRWLAGHATRPLDRGLAAALETAQAVGFGGVALLALAGVVVAFLVRDERRPAAPREPLPAEERAAPPPEPTGSAPLSAAELAIPARSRLAGPASAAAPAAASSSEAAPPSAAAPASPLPAASAAPEPEPAAPASPAAAASPVAAAPTAPAFIAAPAAPAPAGAGATGEDEAHWKAIYEDFQRVRAECGEAAAPAYERFREKLQKNREQLVERFGCRTVKFQVYVKDGKAALKASPVR